MSRGKFVSTATDGKTEVKTKTVTQKAKKYASFWMEHVKKGEMPWTQWYCCHVINGFECEKENHRIRKQCKRCQHHVCDNCVKGTL